MIQVYLTFFININLIVWLKLIHLSYYYMLLNSGYELVLLSYEDFAEIQILYFITSIRT